MANTWKTVCCQVFNPGKIRYEQFSNILQTIWVVKFKTELA